MTNFDFTEAKILLSTAKRVAITTHVSPDGDAIGSCLALSLFLKKLNYITKVITPDNYPEFLHWMPGNDDVLQYHIHKSASEEFIKTADLIFCLDFNSPDRLSGLRNLIEEKKCPKILIDHHQKPDKWTDVLFSDTSASSTCEMIYRFMEGIDQLKQIDEQIGSCLYVGIITDTGSFKFPSTTSFTLRISAELLDLGVDGPKIQNLVYDNSTEDRLRLLGYALTEKLIIEETYHTAIIGLSSEELKKFNYKAGDTEGLVNYPLGISGVRMSVFLSAKNGEVRMSFRSKGKIPVNEIAAKHFKGGGHINAAGGVSNLSVDETIKFLKSILPEFSPFLC